MRVVTWKSAIVRISIFSILIISPLFLLSEEEPIENRWIQEGNILLESKQYEEASILANSILGSDPSNVKAEFILTQAWIGMGREERKKGNFLKAKEYLEKAYRKWPLNESIRNEIAELNETPLKNKKSTAPSGNNSRTQNVSNKNTEELALSINLLRIEIEKLKGELEIERINESANVNRFYWICLLLGIQIVALFGIFKKIKR
ncbi:tetratricopeptide repeat protein [Leptospira koniambonensis]|uniref:tetratricopeptide repeat protein n=1 Tax=Leptospira koniambonensis TaxID=2484950 RepID=UPI003EBD4D03